MIHPILQTRKINHTDIAAIWREGVGREGYNGDNDEWTYLCYKFVGENVERVTILDNIYLAMSKQTKGFCYRFIAVQRQHAKRMANEAIIKFQTGQPLYGCITRRQAIRRMRVYIKNYSIEHLKEDIKGYNESTLSCEHLYSYGNRCYVSKEIIDELVDINKFMDEYEQR